MSKKERTKSKKKEPLDDDSADLGIADKLQKSMLENEALQKELGEGRD
jgi:hypothetical protein